MKIFRYTDNKSKEHLLDVIAKDISQADIIFEEVYPDIAIAKASYIGCEIRPFNCVVQCDGCNLLLPIKNGTHINPKFKGEYNYFHTGCLNRH